MSMSAYLVYMLSRQSEIADADAADSEEHSRSEPIENLRQQYATGTISDTEFERKLERLIETEDISQISRSKSLLKNDDSVSHSHTDSASSSELTEEEGY